MLQIPEEKINFRLTKSFRGGRIRRERIELLSSSFHVPSCILRIIGEIQMRILRGCGLAVIAGSILSSSALAQERTIKRSDLPAGVEKTVAAQSSGATIQGFSEEREKGKTFYEAEMMINGRSKDVLMDARGAIVEVEEQVAMNELPADVQDALRTKAGKGKSSKLNQSADAISWSPTKPKLAGMARGLKSR